MLNTYIIIMLNPAIMNIEDSRKVQMIQHLSHVRCTGQESRLKDCSHEGIGVHTCGLNFNENAAVECLGGYAMDFCSR